MGNNNNGKRQTLGAMPQKQVTVYKDSHGFYSEGRARMLQCGYGKIGDENLSLIHQEPDACTGRTYEAGDVVPDIYPNSVMTTKVSTPGEDIWVDPTSFTEYQLACLECCEPLPTLDAPANFAGVPGDGTIGLSWDVVAEATNYIIERDTDPNFGAATEIYSGAVNSHDDDTAVNDTEYFYRLKAQATGYLDSPWVIISATASQPDLAQPENFVATPGDTQAALDWDDVPNADNYVVEQDTTSDFAAPTQIYSGAVSAHTAITLVNGTTYYFRVKAEGVGYDDSPWAHVNATPTV